MTLTVETIVTVHLFSLLLGFRPIEAAVILVPVHDFIHYNTVFTATLIEPFINPQASSESSSGSTSPLVHTLLTLASYLFTHASSTQSIRATAYAALCLTTMLHLVENDVAISAFVHAPQSGSSSSVRLCRQVGRTNRS